MMSLEKAIKKVERYRDDIVTHGGTAEALTVVVEEARSARFSLEESVRLRDGIQQIIADRYAGNFDGLIPKMRALLEGDDR